MTNRLITMFTEWLMLIYYFHSFSNTNIGNPYNVFSLDIFLFLSFNDTLVTLTFNSQDLISNSPYCLPYNSCNVSSENLVLDPPIIP